MRHLIALILFTMPGALVAQQSVRTVDPGMTRTQVVAALGRPATVRTASDYTYMFYPNACGRACGMNDLVTLHRDTVVDAIFRSPGRRYSGTSSSPAAVPPASAARTRPSTRAMSTRDDSTKPAAAKTPAPVQMTPPAQPNDARPSIPLDPPKMQPAPATPPAGKPPT